MGALDSRKSRIVFLCGCARFLTSVVPDFSKMQTELPKDLGARDLCTFALKTGSNTKCSALQRGTIGSMRLHTTRFAILATKGRKFAGRNVFENGKERSRSAIQHFRNGKT